MSEKNDFQELSQFLAYEDKLQDVISNRSIFDKGRSSITYLDNAGTPLYSTTQVNAFARDLASNLYGNPHSGNQSSQLTSEIISNIRFRALRFFNANPDEYCLVFTSGCTASLQTLADCFDPHSQEPRAKEKPTLSAQNSYEAKHGVPSNGKSDDDKANVKSCNMNNKRSASNEGIHQNGLAAKSASKTCVNDCTTSGVLCFPEDSHTSVVGMREVFSSRGLSHACLSERHIQEMRRLCESGKDNKNNIAADCIVMNPGSSINSAAHQPNDNADRYRKEFIANSNTQPVCLCPVMRPSVTTHEVVPCKVGGEMKPNQTAKKAESLMKSSQAQYNHKEHPPNTQNNETNKKRSAPNSGRNYSERTAVNRTEESVSCYPADKTTVDCNNLFIYALQSNFNGARYPEAWVDMAHNGHLFCTPGRWWVALDVANYVSTSSLDLATHHPDFVALSFYKIFGFPTGLGALIVRKSSQWLLRKSYFGGGTLDTSIPATGFHKKRDDFVARFEDGTLPFLEIIALSHSMDFLENSIAPMVCIQRHTFQLARFVYTELRALKHDSGKPVVKLYHHSNAFEDCRSQGPIVNFNVLKSDGSYLGYAEVDKLAEVYDIHLRTGCFCNSGACQIHLSLSPQLVTQQLKAGHVCSDAIDLVDGKPTGSCRVSFGYCSTLRDALVLLDFIDSNFCESREKRCFVKNGEAIFKRHIQKLHAKQRADLHPRTDSPVAVESSVKTAKESNLLEVDKHSKGDIKQDNANLNKDQRDSSCGALSERDNNGETGPTDVKLAEVVTSVAIGQSVSPTTATVKEIYIYPVKSGAALKVSQWPVGHRGLLYDRHWVVVTDLGVCLTQKRCTSLCRLRACVQRDSGQLELSFTGVPEIIRIDLEQKVSPTPAGESSNKSHTRVCGNRVMGVDCGDRVACWLQTVLDIPGLRLLQQADNHPRTASVQSAETQVDGNTCQLSLANQAQYLLVNKATCRHLFPDESVESMVSRMRSNLVVDVEPPFMEESWGNIQIGNTVFQSDGPCTRCQMIGINQSTGEKDAHVLAQLSNNRNNKMNLGILLRACPTSADCHGVISTEDRITILE